MAVQLATEFGMGTPRRERPPAPRGVRVFETTRWVLDQPLSGFVYWRTRIEATVRRVAVLFEWEVPSGVLRSGGPGGFRGMGHRLAAEGLDASRLRDPDEAEFLQLTLVPECR